MYPLIGYILVSIKRIIPHLGALNIGQVSTAARAPRLHNSVEFGQVIIAPRRAVGLLRLAEVRTVRRDIDVFDDRVWFDEAARVFDSSCL